MEKSIRLEDGWCANRVISESEKGGAVAPWVGENLVGSVRDKGKYYTTGVATDNGIRVGMHIIEKVFTEAISGNGRFGLLVW